MKIILDIMWVIGTPFRAFVASVFSVICFFALVLNNRSGCVRAVETRTCIRRARR